MLLLNRFIISLLVIFCISIPTFADNLISIQSGGKAIHWTSEKHPFIARNVIDNNKSSYWVSSGNTLPHVLTFSLPSNQRFESLSFISKTNEDKGTWAKHIRISSADPFPHMGGWEIIADINLPESGDEKIINIEAKRGRYFRLEIFSTQDELAKEASFSELKVIDVIER